MFDVCLFMAGTAAGSRPGAERNPAAREGAAEAGGTGPGPAVRVRDTHS